MNPKEFIAKIAPMAMEEQMRTGVLASITIAQAIEESGWGEYAPGNNLFGIKGDGQEFTTQEYVNGHFITITDGFRAYDSWEGSCIDHSDFLVANGRYAGAGFFVDCADLDYAAAAKALQNAGYATNPSYASNLKAHIERHALHQYDEEAENMKERLDALEEKMSEQAIELTLLRDQLTAYDQLAHMESPDFAKEAVASAVAAGIIDSPDGASYDFYRTLTVLHRKGLV